MSHCDNEVTYCLVACTLAIYFRDIFTKHFSPDKFDVAIHGRCEIMVHNVRAILNLHPD
jgi:hypothetical protein